MTSMVSVPWLDGVPVAHAGHWLANLLYLLPVLVLAGGIAYQRMADRKARAADQADESTAAPDSPDPE